MGNLLSNNHSISPYTNNTKCNICKNSDLNNNKTIDIKCSKCKETFHTECYQSYKKETISDKFICYDCSNNESIII
jgi:hypothetical protein